MTVMTTVLWIIAILMIVVGVAGAVLPALPGVPLIFVGMLLAAWINNFQLISVFTIVVMAILMAVAVIIDYVAAILTTQKAGASKPGIIGAAVGTIAGIFSGFWGLLFMPFLGAIIGELTARRDILRAGKIGAATWLGLIVAIVVKLAVAFTMVGVFVATLLI